MKFNHGEDIQEEKPAGLNEKFGFPPSPEKNAGTMADIGVYGMSLQGSSHIERGQPCQDYSDFRFLPGSGLLIGAISDGVGSCSLSHWGSYTVVTTVLDCLEKELEKELLTKKITDIEGKAVGDILRKAFAESRDAVEELADHLSQPVPNFYSTLTAAIYDGSTLYYGHIGDDGIVVQLENGKYQLVTTRHKGEEANSVNPLQAGAPDQLWQFGRVAEPVVGFLMSTDGVLDQFVGNKQQNNRVFYPFLEKALYCMTDDCGRSKEEVVQGACDSMRKMLDQPEYRNAVTDDITVLAAANMKMLKTAAHPAFSKEEWKREAEEYRREIQKKLYAGSQSGQVQAQNGAGDQRGENKREAGQSGTVGDGRPDQRAAHNRGQKPEGANQTARGPEYIDIFYAGPRKPRNNAKRREPELSILESLIYAGEDMFRKLEDSLAEPKMCYCPKCRKKYEITWDNSFRYCPDCGVATRPLKPDRDR